MVGKEVSVIVKFKNTFKHDYFPGFLVRTKLSINVKML